MHNNVPPNFRFHFQFSKVRGKNTPSKETVVGTLTMVLEDCFQEVYIKLLNSMGNFILFLKTGHFTNAHHHWGCKFTMKHKLENKHNHIMTTCMLVNH